MHREDINEDLIDLGAVSDETKGFDDTGDFDDAGPLWKMNSVGLSD